MLSEFNYPVIGFGTLLGRTLRIESVSANQARPKGGGITQKKIAAPFGKQAAAPKHTRLGDREKREPIS